MSDQVFHVIISTRKEDKHIDVLFSYVGTAEEASVIGSDYQKKLDKEDRATSRWTRKRVASIVSVEGRIGQEVIDIARVELSKASIIGIDLGSKEGDHTAIARGKVVDGKTIIEDIEVIDVNKDS